MSLSARLCFLNSCWPAIYSRGPVADPGACGVFGGDLGAPGWLLPCSHCLLLACLPALTLHAIDALGALE